MHTHLTETNDTHIGNFHRNFLLDKNSKNSVFKSEILEEDVWGVNRSIRILLASSDLSLYQWVMAMLREDVEKVLSENRKNDRPVSLSGADLSRIDLSGLDLSGVNFRGAVLFGASLRDSDLSDADLREADLREADFEDADLSDALLSDAEVTGASFRGATLVGAEVEAVNFDEAILEDADFL